MDLGGAAIAARKSNKQNKLARGWADAAVLHWGHAAGSRRSFQNYRPNGRTVLVPTAEERSGYVPNVVYSCGGMIHDEVVVIPYAMSDVATSFATVELGTLLKAMKAHRP